MSDIDEWMVKAHEMCHSYGVQAQDMIIDQDEKGNFVSAGEVRVAPRPGHRDASLSRTYDLRSAYWDLRERTELDGIIYISNCFGYSIKFLSESAHTIWPGAPKTEWGVRTAIERGRGEWGTSLRKLGIRR